MERIDEVLRSFPKNTLLQRLSELPDNYPIEELSPEERLRRNLNVSSLDNTFENFNKVAGTEKAYNAFYEFAINDKSKPFLGCYGGVGSGKSHLMEATAIKLHERGIFARVITATFMFSSLKKAMKDSSIPPYQNILDSYCRARILLLDDIGAGSVEGRWMDSVLETIFMYRFHEKLRTVFVTNMDFTELPERVVSRFKDRELSVLVLNESQDYRRLK